MRREAACPASSGACAARWDAAPTAARPPLPTPGTRPAGASRGVCAPGPSRRAAFAALLALPLQAQAQTTCTSDTVRLDFGNNADEGEVLYCHNNEWRHVCDDHWHRNAADVVCRQLGYTRARAATSGTTFTNTGTVTYWLDDVMCTGTEASLGMCTHADFGVNNCQFSERAGVRCVNDPKPDVTISTSSPSEHYSTGHNATFTVTRTGVTTNAVTVTVNLSQDKPFLDESQLLREVTIDAGETSMNFSFSGAQLQLPANEPVETGTLTATVEAGPDNNIGAPASASVDIVPFMTVRLEQATYTVLEDVGTLSVKIIARTGNGAAQPSSAFGVGFSTASETATFNQDFTSINGGEVTFQPGDFSADGAAWKAVKTVQVTILDDTGEEPDEAFQFRLERISGLDYRILSTNADGTANLNPFTRITIEDDERRPRLTLPPGSIKGVPERHDAVTPFDFTMEFSAAVDFTNAEMAAALQMETRNATVSAKAGDSRRMWTITATPNITDYSQQIAITIRSPEKCNDAGAICTADGRKLQYSRVVGVGAGGLKPRPPKPLTVGFILDDDDTHPVLDYSHDNGDFIFQLVFSEPLANAPRTGDAAARLAWWQNKLTRSIMAARSWPCRISAMTGWTWAARSGKSPSSLGLRPKRESWCQSSPAAAPPAMPFAPPPRPIPTTGAN